MLGISKYLDVEFPDYNVIRILDRDYSLLLNRKLSEDDMIFIQSGGHFGNMAYWWHHCRKEIIQRFPDNKIIQFPVSVCYTGKNAKKEFVNDIEFFSNREKLLILCRSNMDTKLLASNFKYCRIEFMPDFAFYLDYDIYPHERSGALLVLRDNPESNVERFFGHLVSMAETPFGILSELSRKDLIFILKKYARKLDFKIVLNEIKRNYGNVSFVNIQMSKIPLSDNNIKEVVQKTVQYYATFNIVITDRFHSRVFSQITNTPCVYLGCRTPSKCEAFEDDYSKYFGRLKDMILDL